MNYFSALPRPAEAAMMDYVDRAKSIERSDGTVERNLVLKLPDGGCYALIERRTRFDQQSWGIAEINDYCHAYIATFDHNLAVTLERIGIPNQPGTNYESLFEQMIERTTTHSPVGCMYTILPQPMP